MRRTGWAWRAVTTIALAPLLAVGGCAGDEPTDVPTTATATTVDATPTPSPTADLTRLPEKPAAMSEPTTDGAIAAATYVLDLYTYTFAVGDTGPWRQITRETCELCVGLAHDVEQMVAADERSTSAVITVDSSKAVEISDDRWFGVDLEITQGASARLDAEGETVASDPGGRYAAAVALSWDGGWFVDDLGFEPLTVDGETEG